MNEHVFDQCIYSWTFHVDSSKSGFPENKRMYAQEKSLKIQQTHTRIDMWANVISALMMIIAVLSLLYGQGSVSN